jgi:hypothetical protein
MQTASLLVITLVGGLVIPFAVAGWTSYNDGKLPDLKLLFRLFLAGIVTSGAGAYAWLFGAGGDPIKALETVGEALEVKEVIESLSAGVSSTKEKEEKSESKSSDGEDEIKVGVPPF